MTLNEIDRDALARALIAGRAESPGRAKQIDSKLQHESWQEVAEFAAHCVQGRSLNLQPWQKPPLCYFSHLESALREPYGDVAGAREAAEVLKKMLALGLSRFEPNPLQAIQQAEANRQTSK
jgi:hypothetical protein